MNIRNSGKIPDIIKKLAALAAALSIALCAGCSGGTGDTDDSSGYESSVDSETHIPVEDSSGSSDASSSQGASSGAASSSSDASGGSSVLGISESGSGDSSGQSGENSSQTVSSVTSDPTSEPTSQPDPPPVIVVPTIINPSSPGTMTASGADGVIDYSNASQGYVSARYTGSNPKVKLQVQCNGRKENHDIPSNGTTVYIPLIFGSGSYTLYLGENISGTSNYAEVAMVENINVSLDSTLSTYLYPNMYANYAQSSDCVYKAAEVCAGKTSDIEKIAAVFGWVTSNVTYDHNLATTVQKGYVPDPNRTYSSRKGICFDYASLMCAMLRSQSIPTRLVVGNASPDIYHAWNEVYTEETGWITPELLLKNAGYNIVDSTFYASAGNKSQIASYISNSVNYQALHYY